MQCLDALGDILTDQGHFHAVEKLMQEAARIELLLPHPDPLRMARRVYRPGIARHKPTAVRAAERILGYDWLKQSRQVGAAEAPENIGRPKILNYIYIVQN